MVISYRRIPDMEKYNFQKLDELLRDFYTLTNIKICFYDEAENEVCFCPERLSDFCQTLRESPEMDKKCRLCDKHALTMCKKTRKQFSHICHAGLLECFSPVIFQNAVIGYMVIGQIRTDDTSVPPSFLNEELRQKFLALPVIPRTHIRSALRILDACAGYEYLKTLISGPAHRIESRIAGFIEENLSGDLSVNALCRAFHLSRSEIYSIFHENFASSVAEYIKARRLEKAASLLQETCLPINKIATLCGIPDYNYFSKQFKNAFGISPTQRRNGKTPEPQSTEKN